MRSEFENWHSNSKDKSTSSAFAAGWMCQQAKIDELQRRNQMLSDNIKEQGQKLVYQNEVIETQAEKLLGLRDEKADLQERIDKALSITGNYCDEDDAALLIYVLEKALRGES